MEVDSAESAASSNLLAVVTALAENPNSEVLHYRNIVLSEELGLAEEELETARETLVSYFPASDDVWLPLLSAKVARHAKGELTAAEVDATFERAERDYFSIPIFKQHIIFLFNGNAALANGDAVPESDEALFSTEAVKERASAIVGKAAVHTMEGHLVWNEWRDWLQQSLERSEGSTKEEFTQLLKLEYLKRLTTPHSTNEQTFQSYSSFVSSHLPPSAYESSLVHASKVRQPALGAWRNRERWQVGLTSPQAYATHLQAELQKRTKSTDARLRDPAAIINLYERAIGEEAKRKSGALRAAVKGLTGGAAKVDDDNVKTSEAWLSEFWTGYLSFLREEDVRTPDIELPVLARAVRSVPSNGGLWLDYLRALEFHDQEDNMLDVYQLALSSGRLSASAIADIAIPAVLPTYRLLRSGFDADLFTGVITMLEDAIQICRTAGGDSRLKLEFFLVHAYLHPTGLPQESYAEESLAGAMSVWEAAVKQYRKYWHVWTGLTEFLVSTLKNIPRARKAFRDFQGTHLALDYPEAVYDAWIAFEEKWGSADDLEAALGRVGKLRAALGEKRAKDAAKAARNGTAYASYGAQPSSESYTAPAAQHTPGATEDVTMGEADSGPSTSTDRTSLKRKADDDSQSLGPESKKTRPEDVPPPVAVRNLNEPPKRDRERNTVFVAGLPHAIEKEDIEAFFKQCGAIHEMKLSDIDSVFVASVEFVERDSVLAALTKDKKKIQDQEVSVYQGWQSTLYVTNFPEKYDDAGIRELFGKYGPIFDVRWPSKRIKTTRRFCYVQYISPSSAESALVLDNFLLDQDRRLSVAISNPEKKKERTDADADQREIHVGGLSRSVGKGDLEALFGKYGPVKDVRLVLDEQGRNKGFAFVEFQDTLSATAALAANNFELKKRRIAVTISDSRAAAGRKPPPASGLARQADNASRRVRVSGLPEQTQEPLLQQALEKIIEKIVRVSITEESHEAVVELETPADASKMVLLQTLQFQDHKLVFAEEFSAATNAARARSRNTNTSKPARGPGSSAPKAKLKLALDQGSGSGSGEGGVLSINDKDSGDTAAAGTTSSFVPRAAASSRGRRGGKPGLGMKRGGGGGGDAASSTSLQGAGGSNGDGGAGSGGGKDQDAFRRMLGGV